jgi:hypothetical protein
MGLYVRWLNTRTLVLLSSALASELPLFPLAGRTFERVLNHSGAFTRQSASIPNLVRGRGVDSALPLEEFFASPHRLQM